VHTETAGAQTGLGQPLLHPTGIVIADDQGRLRQALALVLPQDEPAHVRLRQPRGAPLHRETAARAAAAAKGMHVRCRQSFLLVDAVVAGGGLQARVRETSADRAIHADKVDAAQARVQGWLRHANASIGRAAGAPIVRDQQGRQVRLRVATALARGRIAGWAGGGGAGALVRARVLRLDARLRLRRCFHRGDVQIRVGQSVLATLTGSAQVIDQVRLGQADDAGVGPPV